ncbi:hypothetical protein HMPREF3198_01148 [Winkia neuii]|nr:hypothetical protein HMPREF3198_01148 [Winkia neuii]
MEADAGGFGPPPDWASVKALAARKPAAGANLLNATEKTM